MRNKQELYNLMNSKREQILKSDKKTKQHVRSIKQGLHNASYQDSFITQAYNFIDRI